MDLTQCVLPRLREVVAMADSAEVREAMRALGLKLKSLRRAARLSQEALAAKVHYGRSTVATVEVGLQNAVEAFWQRADVAVAANGELLEAYQALTNLRAAENRAAARSIPMPAMDGSTAPLPVRSAASYVPFLPAALDRPALDWLIGGDDRRSSRDGNHVDEAFLATTERRLSLLRDRDHQLGAGAVYPDVTTFLNTDVRRLVAGSTTSTPPGRRAHAVALGAFELAGYQAVDLGADGVAQQHYLHALALTRATGDRLYGAYLLAVSIGHLALHCGHPHRGLRMVQTAIQGSSSAVTPLVGAALHAVLARAHARLGEERECSNALAVAEAWLSRADMADEPPWVRYLTPAYLADEVAHCMFDLGHYDSARRQIDQAVAGVGASRVRRLAIDTALLASSLARSGQVDEACARGRDAADLARRTTSIRTVQRVAQLRLDISPYEHEREVIDLLDYLHEVLPAAG
jgi:DNA-binding XRE family transcriptional regulator